MQTCVRAYRDPGGTAQNLVDPRCCGDDHHDALGGVPDDVGMSGDEEPQELFLCLVATKRSASSRRATRFW